MAKRARTQPGTERLKAGRKRQPEANKRLNMFVGLIRKGFFRRHAAAAAGISLEMVRYRVKTDTAFRQRLAATEAHVANEYVGKVLELASETSPDMLKWYLVRRFPRDFQIEPRNRLSLKAVSSALGSLMVRVVDMVPPDKKQAFVRAIIDTQHELAVNAGDLAALARIGEEDDVHGIPETSD